MSHPSYVPTTSKSCICDGDRWQCRGANTAPCSCRCHRAESTPAAAPVPDAVREEVGGDAAILYAVAEYLRREDQGQYTAAEHLYRIGNNLLLQPAAQQRRYDGAWTCPKCGATAGHGLTYCEGLLLDDADGGDTRHERVEAPWMRAAREALQPAAQQDALRAALVDAAAARLGDVAASNVAPACAIPRGIRDEPM